MIFYGDKGIFYSETLGFYGDELGFARSVINAGGILYLDARMASGTGKLIGNQSPWKDLSGNGNDGTLNNFAGSSASGWQDTLPVLRFDGVNDYVSTQLTLPVTGTIMTLLKPASFYNYNTLWEDSVKSDIYESWIYADGRVAVRGGSGSIISYDLYNLGGVGNDYMITYTYDDVSKRQELYVDGILRGFDTGFITTTRNKLNIGGSVNTKNTSDMKIFVVFNKVLNDVEILKFYNRLKY